MSNNGIILTLAYPETVVMVSDEWFLRYLYLLGIGKRLFIGTKGHREDKGDILIAETIEKIIHGEVEDKILQIECQYCIRR